MPGLTRVSGYAERLAALEGLEVVGIDNDIPRHFFGEEASTMRSRHRLETELKGYCHYDI